MVCSLVITFVEDWHALQLLLLLASLVLRLMLTLPLSFSLLLIFCIGIPLLLSAKDPSLSHKLSHDLEGVPPDILNNGVRNVVTDVSQ